MFKNKDIIAAMSEGESSGGQSGEWYSINDKWGIKILCDCFTTRKELLASDEYADATQEANAAIEAKKRFKYVPDCQGVKIIKIENQWHIGIILQNLGNETLAEHFDEDSSACDRVLQKMSDKLQALRIFADDLHWRNIMFFQNRYWLIDFGNVRVR